MGLSWQVAYAWVSAIIPVGRLGGELRSRYFWLETEIGSSNFAKLGGTKFVIFLSDSNEAARRPGSDQ